MALPEYCTKTGSESLVGPVREMVNSPTSFIRSNGVESSSAIAEVARTLTTMSSGRSLSTIVIVAVAWLGSSIYRGAGTAVKVAMTVSGPSTSESSLGTSMRKASSRPAGITRLLGSAG